MQHYNAIEVSPTVPMRSSPGPEMKRSAGGSIRVDRRSHGVTAFGEFSFAGDLTIGEVADFYGLPIATAAKGVTLANFLASCLHGPPAIGDRVGLAGVELSVQDIESGRITRVGFAADDAD